MAWLSGPGHKSCDEVSLFRFQHFSVSAFSFSAVSSQWSAFRFFIHHSTFCIPCVSVAVTRVRPFKARWLHISAFSISAFQLLSSNFCFLLSQFLLFPCLPWLRVA